MNTPRFSKAARLACALAAGAALTGCATYGPAYPAYPAYAAAPAAVYPASPYYGYGYGDPYYDGYYGYGGPALALDFRFHDRGYYRGGPRYYHGYANRGHAWGGPRAGGPRFGGGGHWGGARAGGGFGGGRSGFGGGHGHR